ERRHRQRLKALAEGRPLPEGRGLPALLCLAMGGLVPLASLFATTWMAAHPEIDDAFAKLALLMGIAGLICGTVLALRVFGHRVEHAPRSSVEKPTFDPE